MDVPSTVYRFDSIYIGIYEFTVQTTVQYCSQYERNGTYCYWYAQCGKRYCNTWTTDVSCALRLARYSCIVRRGSTTGLQQQWT
eukprot:5076070-Prymnesium_polylepis.3